MYKLAVFDMDGTLLNSNHEISDENLKALKYLEELGVKVVIATGRPAEFLKKHINELQMDEYVITCNGSVISHPVKKELLYESTIEKSEAIKVIDMCEEFGYEYLIYANKAIVSRDNTRLRLYKRMGADYKEEDKANIIETEDVDYIKNSFSPNKILILEKDPVKYKTLWKNIQDFENIEYTQSWVSAMDISPKGDTKGNAVKKVCEHYGIDKSEVISFGDQLNDISMIKYAGLGIAMGNAEKEVKENADYVTLTNDENGVAKAIYKFVK